MIEVEAILNSRPLTNVADQPDNEKPLTPNHFFIQRRYSSLPPGNLGDQQTASFKNWRHACSSVHEPHVAAFDKGVPANINQEALMDRKQPASFENQKSYLGNQILDAERNLAPWKSRRNIPWTRRRNTNFQGKYGFTCVRSPASHGFFP